MRKVRMRKMIALLLAAVMAFSLVIVTGAAEVTTKETATLKVECTGVTADGVATFEVSIVAPASGVAALQFTLTPENMTQVVDGVSWPEAAKLTSVFNLNSIIQNEKGNFGYTKEESSDTGKFIAYGGDVTKDGRYLSGTTTLLTIQYKLNAGVDTGTLEVSDFKACQSGDKAIGDNGYICTAPESVEAKRPTPTPSTGIKGDVTGDDKVNIADVGALARYVKNSTKYPLGDKVANADITGDSKVNIADVGALARYVKNPTKYPLT